MSERKERCHDGYIYRSDSFISDFREIKESIDFRYKRTSSPADSALFSLRFLIYLSASIPIASTWADSRWHRASYRIASCFSNRCKPPIFLSFSLCNPPSHATCVHKRARSFAPLPRNERTYIVRHDSRREFYRVDSLILCLQGTSCDVQRATRLFERRCNRRLRFWWYFSSLSLALASVRLSLANGWNSFEFWPKRDRKKTVDVIVLHSFSIFHLWPHYRTLFFYFVNLTFELCLFRTRSM